MRSLIAGFAFVAVAGASAIAQAPTPAAGRGAPGAEMLLARTGELALTDAQVTRLAAIARRSAARRQSMRASLDSVRTRIGQGNRPDSAARRQLATRLRADAERMREQAHADRRDAIAVLTADQQAKAWELVSHRGRPGMRGGMGRGMRPQGMRPQGMRPQGARRMREMRPQGPPDGQRPVPGRQMQPRRPVPPVQ